MTDPAFSFEAVTKRWKAIEALRGLTLTIPRGSVVGLIGRNGAGKSTAIRCLVGLQRPTSGAVRLLGEDPWAMSPESKQRIGYVSERPIPFPGATAEDLIGFCVRLYPRWDAELAGNLLARFAIDPRRPYRELSLGQQRAVALLLALAPRPEVLVLDEPASNLDPVMRRQFLDEVLDLVADPGRTVLFSSHNLADVERVADRVALLHEGRLLLARETDELKERTRRLRLIFSAEAPAVLPIPGLVCLRRAGTEVLATVEDYRDDLPARLTRETGARVEVSPLPLEELFIDLVGEHAPARAAAR
jgi:ABC-2 type transport system ATP-binding protein